MAIFGPQGPKKRYPAVLLGGLLLLGGYFFLFSTPRNFPSRKIITIPQGTGLLTLSQLLEKQGVIRSPLGFRTAAILFGGEHILQAGDYYLPNKENAIRIAWRIVHGSRGLATIRTTIPEGYTNAEISNLFDDRFPLFDHAEFLDTAREGYLFPDTYFVEVSAMASSTITLLANNFEKKIEPWRDEIAASPHTLNEILTMASILEAEGKSPADMSMIAGVLWKRIGLHMPLQVDAKKETYTYQGLPDHPINNPGLVSIEAALRPTASPYLYYISDKEGKMHYARTLDDHNKNIAKYLK
ncbi:MAG: aminodeoxychorismate lyase, protein [Parcubacteria group bacterium]|nr:aminodeoxychorismate lyase, protein [Parcubacteria group bacterium]